VKILVTLFIASFVALDFYLWDYLQKLLTANEKNLQQHVNFPWQVANKQLLE